MVWEYENIKLENNTFLNRFYGKYRANLTFISSFELNNKSLSEFEREIKEEITQEPIKFFNCNTCSKVLRGFFRINKKGTKIFELSQHGNYIFIALNWGGAFSKTDGKMVVPFPKEKIKYFHDAPSNGGGLGNTYYVFDLEDWKNLCNHEYNEDDF